MMDDTSLRHLIEATTAGLVALGAWVWRIARIDQQREDRLARLEQDRQQQERRREEHMQEHSAMMSTLRLLEQSQAVQTESLKNITRSLDELRKDQRQLIAARMAGGNRWNDPPAGGGA